MRPVLLALPAAILACDPQPGLDSEAATAAVQQAFDAANPPGRTGLELRGKAVWLETDDFDKSCLETKNLAFNDDPGGRPANAGPRISPTYDNQRFLTASTEQGYCVYLGDSPKLEVGKASWGGDRYRVDVTIGVDNPTPWFECLTPARKARMIEVFVDEAGQPTVEADLSLGQGGCPAPLPTGEARGPGVVPPKLAHAPPSKAEVVELASKLDKALFDGDLKAVQDLTACYNLVDEAPFYGNCSVGEFIAVGPSFQGEQRAQDGTPWAEYTIRSLDDIGRIVKDRTDSGMAHATMKHKRTGKDRSFAVKYTKDGWKMVGVIGQKAEALTSVRYLYDLHRADRRGVFERRLAGEEIDEQGEPLNPVVEEQVQGGGEVTF